MEVFAVEGLPEFTPGDDIAAAVERTTAIDDDDIVCVSSTIVSKVEDRRRSLDTFTPRSRAERIAARQPDHDPRFVEAVLTESEELLLAAPFLLTVTPFGHVAPNAGIDRSNVGQTDLLLLPTAPTESARRIQTAFSANPAVIVTDTCGRPFRTGQRGVAIGYAGLPAARDWRGETDRDGRELTATVEAIVDELAAAANLVTGEGGGGTPVGVIREFSVGDHDTSHSLFRDPETDFVRQALRTWSYED